MYELLDQEDTLSKASMTEGSPARTLQDSLDRNPVHVDLYACFPLGSFPHNSTTKSGTSGPHRLPEARTKFPRDSRELLELVDTSDTLICVGNQQLIYATNYPYTDAELQNIGWLFREGTVDFWVDKVHLYHSRRTRARDYGNVNVEAYKTPILKLGAALRSRTREEEKTLKYVIAVQAKSTQMNYKLLVSQSREAAGMDIFYELLNGNSVVFVGAVLKAINVPVERDTKAPETQFVKVGYIEGLEKVGKRCIGVIC